MWLDYRPPIEWVTRVLTAGVQQPEREAGHSPPSIVEVKNNWNYLSSPPFGFMTCTGTNLTYLI